jgi:2-methylcitrate dehydratase PrpD
MDADVARIHRPTGVTGPIAAAAAGARLLGLEPAPFTSAVALAANTTLGFNQWAHTGGSEMFFHAGFAARNAVSAVRLAAAGAFASPSALDGEAGLFASLGKPQAGADVRLFEAAPEILSVYHKAVPVCNFAQTPCLAALELARAHRITHEQIAAITIRVPAAGARYPGCDSSGPFAHSLQGKMSIQFNVAAALLEGGVSERNFSLLDDPRVQRLISLSTLEVDEAMNAAYPELQGGEVAVRTTGGEMHCVRLENVVNASDEAVRERFRVATGNALGEERLTRIEAGLDALAAAEDAGALARLLRAGTV